MTLAILAVSPQGIQTAKPILSNYPDARLFSTHPGEGVEHIDHIQSFVAEQFIAFEGWIFIGAMGICVRSIAPLIGHKYTDPAVINIDSTGHHVVSVLSGHIGGANELTRDLAARLLAEYGDSEYWEMCIADKGVVDAKTQKIALSSLPKMASFPFPNSRPYRVLNIVFHLVFLPWYTFSFLLSLPSSEESLLNLLIF